MDRQERLQRRRYGAIALTVLAWLGGGGLFLLWDPLAVAIYAVVSLIVGAILLAVDWSAV